MVSFSLTFGYNGMKRNCLLIIYFATFVIIMTICLQNWIIIQASEYLVLPQTDKRIKQWTFTKDLSQDSDTMDIISKFLNNSNTSLSSPIWSSNCALKGGNTIYKTSMQINKGLLRKDIKARFNRTLFLFSEGGSGNTWMRILLEYITGISTGVPYDDKTFRRIFNQEGKCHNGLLVCKCHPRWFYKSAAGHFEIHPQGNWRLRGRNNGATGASDGAVWIIRNPWHSMWSLFQLIAGRFLSHSHRIKKDKFNVTRFRNEVWLGTTEIALVEHWKNQFMMIDILKQNRSWNDDNIVIIKYEKLLDESKRVDEFNKVIQHLYKLDRSDDEKYFVVPTHDGLKYFSYEQLLVRIECGFEYCSNMHTKQVKRDKYANINEYVSMEQAYLSLGNETICNIWNSLKPLAEPLGYTQLFLDEFDCDKMDIKYHLVDNINNPNWTHIDEVRKERQRLKALSLQAQKKERLELLKLRGKKKKLRQVNETK